jgi:hypothetical protein
MLLLAYLNLNRSMPYMVASDPAHVQTSFVDNYIGTGVPRRAGVNAATNPHHALRIWARAFQAALWACSTASHDSSRLVVVAEYYTEPRW